MLISVVIPAFNQAEYLREAIASALEQTHREIEVIVVDDGSTDATRDVCASFRDNRVNCIVQVNDGTRGIGARNRAMLLARGEWIALLDQDDRWAPTKLEKQLQCIAEHPNAVAVFCAVHFIDATGVRTGTQAASELPEGDVFHALLERNRFFAASGMFRRAMLSVCGLPNESTGLADWVLWLSIARHGPVAVVREALADYREHAAGYQISLLAADRLRFATDQWRAVESQRNRLHERCAVCSRIHSRARRRCGDLFLRAARAALRNGDSPRATQALRMAWFAAPAWLLRPWVVLPQALRLLASALRGWAPG